MPGLILKLSPFERVLLNGAVIENCDRRTRLSILSPNSQILRLRDAIHPRDTTSPVADACYTCQLLLIGELDPEDGTRRLLSKIEALSQALRDQDSQATLNEATEALQRAEYYRTLRVLRSLISREQRLLAYAGGQT